MRVLFHPFLFFPERWNGIDEHLLILSRYLPRDRFDLSLLVHPGDGEQTPRLAERAGIRPVAAPYESGAPLRRRLSSLRRLYSTEEVDILHMHSPSAAGLAPAALAARLGGVQTVIASIHQVQPARLPNRTRTINCTLYPKLVQATIACSAGVKGTLVDHAGLRAGKVQVIHYGVEPPGPPTSAAILGERRQGDIRFGYFGRLSVEKGVSHLLHALSHLKHLMPAAHTYVVGDGPERPRLEEEAASLRIADRVHFLGFRPDARAIMEEIDIVVHVPLYEGQGIVLLEAMAAGRPVVTNDAPGGIAEAVVDGENGVVVTTKDPQILARRLALLAADPVEQRRLGANGRSYCERHFSVRRMAERIAAVYEGHFVSGPQQQKFVRAV